MVNKSLNLGNLSVLVNNASQRNFIKFEDMTLEDWRDVMNINLDAVFLTCKYAIPKMKEMIGVELLTWEDYLLILVQ